MAPFLSTAFANLEAAAARRGLNRRSWAEKAGVRAETLSRLPGRADCDLGTLNGLAHAAGQRLMFVDQPDRRMPESWDRATEGRYAALCADGSLDLGRWLSSGPSYFASGLAMMMAGSRGVDRKAYLALARALCPAMADAHEFATWLSMTPARPSRFLPMVRVLRAGSPA